MKVILTLDAGQVFQHTINVPSRDVAQSVMNKILLAIRNGQKECDLTEGDGSIGMCFAVDRIVSASVQS